MAHLSAQTGYAHLADRLNRFPYGAPPSELLNKILKLLLSPREAELAARLPLRPFTVAKAARAWRMGSAQTRRILDALAGKAMLLDLQQDGETDYTRPPPMAGFFEFSLMRVRGDIDQKALSELFYRYINQEEEFIRSLFVGGDTQQGRAFVHEPALSPENALVVLEYERASHVIETAPDIGISLCFCRHKMAHVGRNCDAPKDICMTFNTTAASLIRHGFARPVDAVEGVDLLQKAHAGHLVQFGENVQTGVNFICHCCGCCCEAMIATRRFGTLRPVQTTGFIPRVRLSGCNGCGKCAQACPVEAMGPGSANASREPKKNRVRLDTDVCLGCGVCASVCPEGAISLESRLRRVITPVNSSHRVVMMAIERDRLQDLIFDNQVMQSHRAMAAVLGVILKLPPIKRAMASRQLKSRYLGALFARLGP